MHLGVQKLLGVDEVLPSWLLAFQPRQRRESGTVTLKQGHQSGGCDVTEA